MKRLELIEISRGVAAILVVCFHATGIVAAGKYFGTIPLHGMFNFGYSGVDFFFVLSGFIIYSSTAMQHQDRSAINLYLKRRLIRIYPIYWVVALLFLPLFLLYGQISAAQGIGFQEVFRDFALLPRDDRPFVAVAWTLRHEMLFYFSFILFFINVRLAWLYFLAWFGLILYAHVASLSLDFYITKFYLDLHNIEFIFGIVVAWFVISRDWDTPVWCFPVGLALFAIGATYEVVFHNGVSVEYLDYHIIFGVASLLIIAGVSTMTLKSDSLLKKVAIFFGRASYSVYLIHYLVLSVLVKILVKANIYPEVGFLLLVIMGLIIGGGVYQYIERPLLKVVRLKMGVSPG